MKPYWQQDGNKIAEYCRCGCGQKVKTGNRFINGHNRKGKKLTESHKAKIGDGQKRSCARGDRKPMPSKIVSKICKGCHNIFFIRFTERATQYCSILCFNNWFSVNHRDKNAPNYGKKHSQETKKIISAIHKGSKRTEETKKKMSKVRKGMKFTRTHRINLSKATRKSSLNLYGLSRLARKRIRKCSIYKMWRSDVFERDCYQCQTCNAMSGNGKNVYLEAHHIKPFSEFPELRFGTQNGITLCLKCHKKVHKGVIINVVLESKRERNISRTCT